MSYPNTDKASVDSEQDALIIPFPAPSSEPDNSGHLLTMAVARNMYASASGENQFSNVTLPWGDWVNDFGCIDASRFDKMRGPVLVPGELNNGGRTASSIAALSALYLDFDNGRTIAETEARLRELGLEAYIYPTYSYGKDTTPIVLEDFENWTREKKLSPTPASDTAGVYLIEKKRYRASAVDGCSISKTETTGKKPFFVVTHAPLEKHRVVIPLAAPIQIHAVQTDVEYSSDNDNSTERN